MSKIDLSNAPEGATHYRDGFMIELINGGKERLSVMAIKTDLK
jgi:hypothetical protein